MMVMRSLLRSNLAGFLVSLCLVFSAWSAGYAQEVKPEESPEPAQVEPLGLPHCPVQADATVNFRIFSDTQDGRVYFCCEGCRESFEKEPALYTDGVNKQREHLAKMEKVQIKCPVTGKPIDPGVWFDYKGEKLAFYDGFACGDFLKNDQPYIANLKDCYTYQSKCPVSGKPINIRKSFILEEGLTVYFCCGNCCAEFAKDPGKYGEAMKAMGYPIVIQAKEGGEAPAPAAEAPTTPEPTEKVARFEGLPPCAVNPGSQVDFTKFFMTDTGPVYFCCGTCCAEFAKDPAKFAEGVQKQREHLASLTKIQVACPVSGKAVDPNVTKEFDGQALAFCCTNCCAEYSKDPAKFAKELVTSFTYQICCPVSGKPIDPTVSFELAAGQKVYFCCGNCCGEFAKDPAKYADKVKAQGYAFDFPTKQAETTAPEAPEQKASADSPPSAETGLPHCVVNPGGTVNFAKFVLTDNGPVYFCCDGCKAKFEADPSKFADGIANQKTELAALPKSQVCCPLSGKPCDPAFTADHEGGKVAFCCGNCCAAFSKDPSAHTAKLLTAYTFQTTCPVSGKPINPSASVEVSPGVNVYFCCQGCKAEYQKDSAKYQTALADQGYKF